VCERATESERAREREREMEEDKGMSMTRDDQVGGDGRVCARAVLRVGSNGPLQAP